jgi:hypothetical protein
VSTATLAGMPRMSVRRGLAAVLLAFVVVGGASGCMETQESDDDAPEQQAPSQQAPGQPEQEDEDD